MTTTTPRQEVLARFPARRKIRKDLLGVSMIHAYKKEIEVNDVLLNWEEFVSISEHDHLLSKAMDGYPLLAEECKKLHEQKLSELRVKLDGVKKELHTLQLINKHNGQNHARATDALSFLDQVLEIAR